MRPCSAAITPLQTARWRLWAFGLPPAQPKRLVPTKGAHIGRVEHLRPRILLKPAEILSFAEGAQVSIFGEHLRGLMGRNAAAILGLAEGAHGSAKALIFRELSIFVGARRIAPSAFKIAASSGEYGLTDSLRLSSCSSGLRQPKFGSVSPLCGSSCAISCRQLGTSNYRVSLEEKSRIVLMAHWGDFGDMALGRLGAEAHRCGGTCRSGWYDPPGEPDYSLHVVEEIGETDLCSRPSEADGADEQTHRPFLAGEDVLDRRAHRRFAGIGQAVRRGIGLPLGFLRWICERRSRPARNFSLA